MRYDDYVCSIEHDKKYNINTLCVVSTLKTSQTIVDIEILNFNEKPEVTQ